MTFRSAAAGEVAGGDPGGGDPLILENFDYLLSAAERTWHTCETVEARFWLWLSGQSP